MRFAMQTNIKTCFWAAFFCATVASPVAMAKEDKFPAADFKPEVVYRNADLVNQTHVAAPSAAPSAAMTAPDPKYPAMSFQPVILHKAVVAEAPAPHAPDPKYPAAYFNPTVVTPAK
jgi:hypothetical protein